MKKLLLSLTIIISVISGSMIAKTYHFSNDTGSPIEVHINFNTKVGSALFDEKLVVQPYSVAFHDGPWAKTPRQIVARSRYDVGVLRDIEKTLNVNTDAKYFAFHFIPTKDNSGNKTYVIRQRVNADAKFILEDHKAPAKPEYYN